MGVTKLQAVAAAKALCPNLVLVNGEDLSPYRQASKQILSALQRFGVAERLGMDEVILRSTCFKHAQGSAGGRHPPPAFSIQGLLLTEASYPSFIGMDGAFQVFLDVTTEVQARLQRGLLSPSFVGHVISSTASNLETAARSN
jgi:DNA polymerase iota